MCLGLWPPRNLVRMFIPSTCILLLLVFAGSIYSAQCKSVTANTRIGDIIGNVRTLNVNGTTYDVSRFLGIPYAQPPVGELRFQKPQPRESFTKSYKADSYGNVCPQNPNPSIGTATMSEDCLFLNIFVPGQVTRARDDDVDKHAVMVFIHGGGFVLGTGNIFVSDTLASFGDVIVVTINYRVGLFGFFTTGDVHAPGNVGLWDQQLSLRWIHENIEAFGGDRNRVTIFGQSAGASSVLYHAMFPQNSGLIHRFISESGSGLVDGVLNLEPEVTMATLASIFNCSESTSTTIVDCLHKMSYEDLLSGIMRYTMQGNILHIAPTIDGEFLRQNPKKFLERRNAIEMTYFRSLDGIIGVSSHEGGFAVKWVAGAPDIDNFMPDSAEMKTKFVPLGVNVSSGNASSDALLATVSGEYTDWSKPGDPTNIRLQFVRLYGDVYFTASSVMLATLHSTNRNKTYFYRFSASPSKRIVETPSWLPGANHADELGFVFGFDAEAVGKMFAGDIFTDPKSWNNFTEPNPWEKQLALEMMRYWTNFAKTGNPNSANVHLTWPEYDMNNRRSIDISRDSHVTSFPYAREANFWYRIIPALQETGSCSTEERTQHCSTTTNKAPASVTYSWMLLIAIVCLYELIIYR